MLGQLLGLHRQKGARAHTQGDEMQAHALRLERRHQFRREVQSRGRRRDRALFAGIDGLVVGPVALVLAPFGGDIGWQWHLAAFGDGEVQVRPRQVEGKGDLTALALGLHGGVQPAQQAGAILDVTEAHPVTNPEPFARLHEGRPPVGRLALMQRGLDGDHGPVPLAHAVQPRRDHLGVVEHQGVARTQEIGQIADSAVLKHPVRPDHQHPRRIPRFGGTQGDAVVRQIEIKVRDAHLSPYSGR